MGSGYRKGVLTGDYMEHLASKDINTETEPPKKFNAATTTSTACSLEGKTGAQLSKSASREDIKLKYGKYGKTEPLGDGSGGYFVTLAQLAYGHPSSEPSSSSGGGDLAAQEDRKINEFIWSGSNAKDSKVPISVESQKMAGERRQKFAAEAQRNPYLTTEKKSLAEAASNKEQRLAAKPALCLPSAEGDGGQKAQVGKKAAGEFVREMDKDFLKIGLRK